MSHVHRGLQGAEALTTNQPHKQTQRYRKYAQNLRGALKRIRVAATTGIEEEDIFGLEGEALASPPGAFDFERDPAKEAAFREWLDEQLENDILQEHGGENTYISSAYQRGLKDADADLRAANVADPDEPVGAAIRVGVHEEAMSALFERNYRELEGFTADLGQDLSRELLEGFDQGEGPYDIGRRIRDTVGQAGETNTGYMARADRIARTEVMRAQHVSTTQRYEQYGVQLVEPLLSPRACDQCIDHAANAPWEPTEARAMYPLHPNCTCSLTIYTGN